MVVDSVYNRHVCLSVCLSVSVGDGQKTPKRYYTEEKVSIEKRPRE